MAEKTHQLNTTRTRGLVPGVLDEQRVCVQLCLRNRHQDAIWFALRLELPGRGKFAMSDQILPPLAFGYKLEQPLSENHVPVDARERLIRFEYPRAQRIYQCERAGRVPQLELRLGLYQIYLAQAEVGEVVAMALLNMRRISRPLEETCALAFRGLMD